MYTVIDVSVPDLAILQLLLLRNDQNELKVDKDWIPAKIPDVKPALTLSQASWLGELIHGVERGLKMRYYPLGSDSADNPMTCVLRAFTYNGGGMYPYNADVRDSYVWTSGFMEKWLKVDDLLKALDNAINGKDGTDKPMAIIEEES